MEDPSLRAYLHDQICKDWPEYCGEIRLQVMNTPIFNAAMAPNGYVEVFSGLLLRVRDEDELAFVLGHEGGHFAENHQIERWQNFKTTANTIFALGLVIGGVGIYNGVDTSRLIDTVRFVGLAATFSYGRDQETEADRIGFQRATAQGFSPQAGAALWSRLIAEGKASDFANIRKADVRASIFATHPLDADRLAALKALAGTKPASGPDPASAHRLRAAIRPHLAAWLKDDLRRRDFGQTFLIIGNLEALGEDMGVLNFARGEVYRLRRLDGDVRLARDAYAAAAQYPDAPASVWRELGEMNRRLGEKPAALVAFRTYLENHPRRTILGLSRMPLRDLKDPTHDTLHPGWPAGHPVGPRGLRHHRPVAGGSLSRRKVSRLHPWP
ncbi:MAG: hypothetical protein CGW95_06375 [Phenylobacterium zucineum]|nr:MAG: hypothetical protein CGW95_06375 [Phenylobacterium zucineum]